MGLPRAPPGLRDPDCYRVTAIETGNAAYSPTAAGLKGGELYLLGEGRWQYGHRNASHPARF